jgi:hypothetical protein
MTIFGASIGVIMCFFRQTLLSVCLVVPFAAFGQLVANDDNSTTQEDVNAVFNIAANDTDPSGVDPASIDLDPSTPASEEKTITTGDGQFTVDNSGEVTFDPNQDFNGDAIITYTIKNLDAVPLTSTAATITVTVNPVNDLPTITAIGNQLITEDSQTPVLDFTVGDVETAPGSLTLSAASDNIFLVPVANVVFGGSGDSRNVQVTPLPDASGVATITVTVSDGTDTDQTSFNVTVTAVNDAPSISSVADQVLNQNGPGTGPLGFTVGDVETPGSLSVTRSSSNTTLVPLANVVLGGSGSSRTVTVNPAADESGVTTITLFVSDGVNTSQTSFLVTVNSNTAPTITSITNQTISEDNPTGTLNFTIGDAETPAGSLLLNTSSDNTTLIPNANIVLGGSGTDRTVTITPALNQSGVATITITVDDTELTTQTTFTVTVNAVDDAPTISAIGGQSINEDAQTGNIGFTISDVETPAGLLTVTRGSSNTTLLPVANIVLGGSGGSRTVNAIPAANQSGTSDITLTVSDGVNNVPMVFQLTVLPVNDLPNVSTVADQTIDENNSTAALAVTVSDIETPAGSLTLSGTSGNPTLVPNGNIVFGGSGANRTVTVTPAANQNGVVIITLTLSDGSGIDQSTFQLTVNNVDDPPTITSISNQTINEDGQTGPLSFTIGDDETPATALTLTPVSNNLGLIPNGNVMVGGTGSLRNVNIIPLLNQNGVATITLTVSDGGQTAQTAFLVTVSALDDPPTITPISDQVINEDGTTGILNFTIDDVDTGPGSLTLSKSSDNTTLVPDANIVLGGSGANRTVQVTPVANLFGVANITITVSDGVDTDQITFQVTVNSVNDAPTITSITNQSINEDSPGTGALGFTVGDVETAPGSLVVTRTSSNTTVVPLANVVLGGSGAARTVTVIPAANQFGTSTITLIVDDGTTTTQTTFDVTVNSVNDLPQITAIADQTIAEDAPSGTGPLAITVSDVETPAGTLTLYWRIKQHHTGTCFKLVFGGSGAARTVTVTPAADQSGTSTITVTVSDGTGNDDAIFLLTVTAVNDGPTITTISDQNINEDAVGGTGSLSFTVGDVENCARLTDGNENDQQSNTGSISKCSFGWEWIQPKRNSYSGCEPKWNYVDHSHCK